LGPLSRRGERILMRKTAKILLVTVVMLGTAFFAGVGAVVLLGVSLDKESKAFVDTAVPAIVSDWDVAEIRKRASTEFNETTDYDDMQQLFDVLHGLGDLLAYGGSTGESRVLVSLGHGIVITAAYSASVDFESGAAEIHISLIKHEGQWQILDFEIAPEETDVRKDII
jgi:hypothetical protein